LTARREPLGKTIRRSHKPGSFAGFVRFTMLSWVRE
jgi:hypothetical protein